MVFKVPSNPGHVMVLCNNKLFVNNNDLEKKEEVFFFQNGINNMAVHFITGTLRNNLMMTFLMEPSNSMKENMERFGRLFWCITLSHPPKMTKSKPMHP